MESIRIANTQGFWGDRPSATKNLLDQCSKLDFLTLDYLAEVSLSIMAIQKEKNPDLGYAVDFLSVVETLTSYWKNGSTVRVISNAGGLNPLSCAKACLKICKEANLHQIKVALVYGDDVLSYLKKNNNSQYYNNLDDNTPLNEVKESIVSANAYFGADGIKKALEEGADIIVTGRVADPSMVVGACLYSFQWSSLDFDAIAGATIAGHLIECGSQVVGGIATHWLDFEQPWNIGFPVIDVYEDGSCVVSKPDNTSGEVSERTVKEQILYEISDPSNYLSPDVTVSFLNLEVKEVEKNKVRVYGAIGSPPSDTYKVSATYREGYRAEGMLTIVGYEAIKKAQRCAQVIYERLKELGHAPHRWHYECLGSGDSVPGVFPEVELYETVLRIAVADPKRETIDAFTKEIAPLVTSGPQGVTGYSSGRPKIRPIFCFWPCLIPKNYVSVNVEVLS